MQYCWIADKAKEWGIGTGMVSKLCRENRISGAYKDTKIGWMIPEDASKPTDLRHKSNNDFTFTI